MTPNQIVMLYLLVANLLITLIWWTIPGSINLSRRKYGLPPKMVIWPFGADMKDYFDKGLDAQSVVGLTVFGIFGATPIIIICMLCKIASRIYRWVIGGVAFSKEEKAQIAVGALSKKEDE